MFRPLLFALIAVLALPLMAEAQQLTIRAANFGDSDPVDFGPRAPQTFQVHGIDLSRFQGAVDWTTARRNGVNFAFIKATEGGDVLDPSFADHWNGAAAAGVLRGAYHFYYFCTDAQTQADWFIRNVPKAPGSLPPVLDAEWNPFSPTCTKRPPAKEVRAELTRFIKRVKRHYGRAPIVYTTPEFYERNEMGKLRGVEFWLRAVAETPDKVYPGQAWAFWQYSGTGRIDGITGNVDLNVFGGNKRAWRKWVRNRSVK